MMGGYVFDKQCDPAVRAQVETGTCRFGSIILLKPDTYSYKRRIKLSDGRMHLNDSILVVRKPFDEPTVKLTWNKRENRFEPVDVDELKPFEWFEINRSELRAANQRYNISEFVMAIEAAMQMGAGISTAGSSKSDFYQKVDNQTEDGESILDLLEQKRYIDAAQFVRVTESSTWDATAKRYNTEVTGLKQKDIKKIRHMAYGLLGVLYLEQQPILTLPQLVTAEQKLVDFGKPVTDQVIM